MVICKVLSGFMLVKQLHRNSHPVIDYNGAHQPLRSMPASSCPPLRIWAPKSSRPNLLSPFWYQSHLIHISIFPKNTYPTSFPVLHLGPTYWKPALAQYGVNRRRGSPLLSSLFFFHFVVTIWHSDTSSSKIYRPQPLHNWDACVMTGFHIYFASTKR